MTSYSPKRPVLQNTWSNTSKKTVIPGQSLSNQAILMKYKMGIPLQTGSRQIETFFRNLELSDKQELSRQTMETMEKFDKRKQAYEESVLNSKKAQEDNWKKFNEFMETQKSDPNP